jgi:hypothetical protein
MNRIHYTSLLLALLGLFLWVHTAAAQEPLNDLRLLGRSPDGSFWIGATPGQVVALAGGSTRQMQVLWRLPADGSAPQQLAEGYNLVVSATGDHIRFTRLDGSQSGQLWGVDLGTGQLSSWSGGSISPAQKHSTLIPGGQTFQAPAGQKETVLVNQFFQAELWLIENNEPPQLLLRAEGELLSDLAWHPGGSAVAFIRTPLGSASEASGELWRLDLAGGNLTRLSQNNVADHTPIWSADGRQLAVVRNNAVVIVPADQLQVEQFDLAPQPPDFPPPPKGQLTPPSQIRVLHHPSNTCRDVEVGQIDTFPFEVYVKQVVPHEVYPSWPPETLKAQAVAARTYAWYTIYQNPDAPYHVSDWVNFQYMCDITVASTDDAVDDTRSEYLAFENAPIIAFFSAENASPTKSISYLPYIRSVDDPVSFGQTRFGHGWGMGQWGAQRWADWHGWSYQAILRHYYSGVTLEEGADASSAGAPNVSIIRLWSNYYQTGNQLWIAANTSDDGGTISQTNIYLSTPLATTRIISEAGPANPDGYLLGVSEWADQKLLTGTLVITAEAFDTVGQRSVSPPITFGLDRVEPMGHFSITYGSGGSMITGSLILTASLVVTDATSGVAQLGLGDAGWQVGGESFRPQTGGGTLSSHIISDTGALNGSALLLAAEIQQAGYWYSRRENWLPGGENYRAYFRLKTSDNTITQEVASLNVIELNTGSLVGLRRLHGIDFRHANVYQEFHVDFPYNLPGVEFRLQFNDRAGILLDRLVILDYPMPFTAHPPDLYPNQRLKLIDAAGNVSADLALLIITVPVDREIYLPIVTK